ncbi:MAG: hypothetical protein Q7S02_00565, partial [bacterium]|nr:hypothetical protein [bacterium]
MADTKNVLDRLFPPEKRARLAELGPQIEGMPARMRELAQEQRRLQVAGTSGDQRNPKLAEIERWKAQIEAEFATLTEEAEILAVELQLAKK